MVSNQLRLGFSAFAHLLLLVLRAEVLRGTGLAEATLGQIRLKLRPENIPKKSWSRPTTRLRAPVSLFFPPNPPLAPLHPPPTLKLCPSCHPHPNLASTPNRV